jgi:hypothetical protein
MTSSGHEVLDCLGDLGLDGWELVDIISTARPGTTQVDHVLVLKREKPPSVTAP